MFIFCRHAPRVHVPHRCISLDWWYAGAITPSQISEWFRPRSTKEIFVVMNSSSCQTQLHGPNTNVSCSCITLDPSWLGSHLIRISNKRERLIFFSPRETSFPETAAIGNTDDRKLEGMGLVLHNFIISSCWLFFFNTVQFLVNFLSSSFQWKIAHTLRLAAVTHVSLKFHISCYKYASLWNESVIILLICMKTAFEKWRQYGTVWLRIYSPAVNNLPVSLVKLGVCYPVLTTNSNCFWN